MKIATYDIVSAEVDAQNRISLPDSVQLLNLMYNPRTGNLTVVGVMRVDEPEKEVETEDEDIEDSDNGTTQNKDANDKDANDKESED